MGGGKDFSRGGNGCRTSGIELGRRVACPQPPNPSPIRRECSGPPRFQGLLFCAQSSVIRVRHHQTVAVHHLGPAPVAQRRSSVRRH
jgi:hypothetical protein